MPKQRKQRLYTRNQGGATRYYGDFRDFVDVGGKREPLKPRGAGTATTDERLAQQLLAERLADLEDRRRRKQRGDPEEDVGLIQYADRHLNKKKQAGKVTDQWLRADQRHLEAAIQFLCNDGEPLPRNSEGDADLSTLSDRSLADITVREAQAYMDWLTQYPGSRGEPIASSTQRKYMLSLSNLYRRAGSEEVVPFGYNPVELLIDLPQESSEQTESDWLEVPEAALLLESARLYQAERPGVAMPFVYPLVATFLLTGGRPSEVFGLTVGDILFGRKLVRFRPNSWRGLKTKGSTREVPLWPQLDALLKDHLSGRKETSGDQLLFPSIRTGGLVRDIRKPLDAIAIGAGFPGGRIRPYSFRHTYTAARLQTLDHGQPISTYTVGRELGHGGSQLVDRVYGHLGDFRHRSDQVEFRVEQHRANLGSRIDAVREYWEQVGCIE